MKSTRKLLFFSPADNRPSQQELVRRMADWPTDWDQRLREWMPAQTNRAIAKRLGATPGLVGFRIQKLGLTRTEEQMELLYSALDGRLRTYEQHPCQQAPGTCRLIQKRPRARPKPNGGVRPPDKPEWWIFLGNGERLPLRRYLWERWIGPVPKGHNVCFADGNPRRCVLENLICLPNSQMAKYYALQISRAMQRRAFWNSDRAKASYLQAARTRIAFNRSEAGKASLARKSETMRQRYREGKINNPFRNLHDKAVAHYITQDPELKNLVLQTPELLELKRAQLLLNRELKTAQGT